MVISLSFFEILEVKSLLNEIKLHGEIARAEGENTGCFVYDLNSLDCRKGCPVCPLIAMTEKLQASFVNKEEGPGKLCQANQNI